jgi:hypothetical protein
MQVTPHNPDLMHVALQAQNMARSTQQERLAFAFQSVAMVSMALMGVTAAAHNICDLVRSEKRGRGR